ncbi:hypothetical protein ABZ016_23450 [Streptomyces sp. NPDC006372]|uniref:hypothetical protein n=1 Tax=Streptomyces sp. NPDC006372 TaxID=3155599 RepID=UPI00339F9D0C
MAAQNDNATPTRMKDSVYTWVIRPALTERDVVPLWGCFQDASLPTTPCGRPGTRDTS